MWYEQTITLFTEEQFAKYASYYFNHASYGITFTFDNNTKIIKVNKPVGDPGSGFRVQLPMPMFKDDIIEFEADYRLVSGENAQFLTLLNGATATNRLKPSTKVGEWEKIRGNFLVSSDVISPKATDYLEVGAYATPAGGEYELKNVVIKFKSKSNPTLETSQKKWVTKGTTIVKRKDGSFAFEPTNFNVPDDWTLTISGNYIQVNFPTVGIRPTAIVHALDFLEGRKYEPRITATANSMVSFTLRTADTNQSVILADIPQTEEIWIGFMMSYME